MAPKGDTIGAKTGLIIENEKENFLKPKEFVKNI
jgi:hypothetical protein